MVETVVARGSVLGSLVPARYILAVLGSIGMSIIYGLKVNLSVAMVAMLDHTKIRSHTAFQNVTQNVTENIIDDACGGSSSGDQEKDGPFDWDENRQGIILSCYFWGYLVSQMPGAKIAENFSAKWVMLFSVAINIVCTLLTPIMSYWSHLGMIFMRIGEGIGGGVTFPAMHVMLASWAPPDERSMMSSIVYAGTSLGTVASMFMAGILAGNWGWESIFYVMGGLSLIWVVLWIFLAQDTPNKQRWISAEERNFITTSLGSDDSHSKTKPKRAVPWKSVFTSVPFYGILVAHTCSNFGWYMVLIELPFYMKQVLKFNIKENAVATSVPFLTMWVFSMVISRTLDSLKQKGKISTTWARKIATLFASVVPAVCLLILCFIGCQRNLAVIVMGIAITCIGGMFCGFLSNHIDIAPNFAGTLMAITNTAATISGITVPLFVGAITHGNQTIDAWRIIFYVTVTLFVIEIIVYTTCGSGEEQPWNKIGEIRSVEDEEGTPLKAREGERDGKNSYTVNK